MKLYDFFEIIYGQHEYSSKRDLKKGEIPLISSKGKNRGIYGYYDISPKYKHVLSVPRTGSICESFYQGEECCIDDNCLVMIPKKKLNINEMCYFALLVRKEKYKYVYGRQVTPDRLGNTKVPLSIPKWIYNIKIKDYSKISHSQINKKIDLKNKKWGIFKISSFFDVVGSKTTPLRLLKKKGRGKFPYVTTKASNNGVDGYYNHYTEEENILTVDSAVVGFCSYRDSRFSASDHVEKLIPKFKLNIYIGLFLSKIINLEQFRYNYGRKFNQDRIKETKINLPINEKNEPDWDFIEKFIKSLPYSKALEI